MTPTFKHIFLTDSGQDVRYTAPRSRGRERTFPPRNRQEHAEKLLIRRNST